MCVSKSFQRSQLCVWLVLLLMSKRAIETERSVQILILSPKKKKCLRVERTWVYDNNKYSQRYNSISSASFSEKSDILDSLSELTFSCPLSASSVAYFFTYSAPKKPISSFRERSTLLLTGHFFLILFGLVQIHRSCVPVQRVYGIGVGE